MKPVDEPTQPAPTDSRLRTTETGLRAFLDQRKPGRIRPSLERIQAVLDTLENPQRTFRSILVVGTNGKGSTAVMLAEILAASGLKVGLFTSPHLFNVTERIRVDGHEIGPGRLAAIVHSLDAFSELTYFETLTVAAYLEFREQSVDVAVLEAGMGGRWDATRTAHSEIAGLTNVGTDHRMWLGDDRSSIAADKGAALAAASVAIRGPGVSQDIVPSLQAPSSRPASDWVDLEPALQPGFASARWSVGERVELGLPLAGRHQAGNLHLALALAIAACERGWCQQLHPETVKKGLHNVVWPGRCSTARIGARTILLDGAHNLEGSRALADYLGGLDDRCNLLFSCLDDKPVEEMAAVLAPAVERVAVFQLDDERAMPIARLVEAFDEAIVADNGAKALAALPDPVVAAGTLRMAEALSTSGG